MTSAVEDVHPTTTTESTTEPIGGDGALVWRLRLLAVALVLVGLAFRQSSGLVVPDTKLDLTADPGGFLTTALHLWDPQGAFGQLQNQAYGYLLPAGPFHWVLVAVGLPAWVVQRLWWSVILVTALVGMWRVSLALGLRRGWVALAVSVAFALSPRMVSEVAVTSAEVWPLAMAPWVLLPLVVPNRSTVWRASWSGVALALVGGVNAVATGAVLVLPALWLASRRWDGRLLRLVGAWLATTVLASTWWLVPLLLLGRYSPPFLGWIENAPITTGTASVFNAFRGATPWLAYLAGPAGASWPAGWQYAVTPLLVVATTLVSAVGLVGALRTPARVRSFLVLAIVVGLALLTLGHRGAGEGFLAGSAQTLLDGPMAPLRNTHKFELVSRLPLLVGFGFALQSLSAWLGHRRFVLHRALLPVVAGSLVVVLASPALAAGMARREGYARIPAHWSAAAAWLDAQPISGSVLVTPSASFSDLTWGSTKDEPLQALSRRPFVVRDAVPLGSAGATRLLDSIENRLGEGQRVAGLSAALGQAGVAYVLVRNEIRLDAQGDPPVAVHRALAESGLQRVASFGPLSGAYAESEQLTVDYRTLVQRPAIEIYAVPAPSVARLVPTTDLVQASGGPENLIQLAGSGSKTDFLFGADADALPGVREGPLVLTDGQRRREVNFGRTAHHTSGLLAADEEGRSGRSVIDYDLDPDNADAGQTVLAWSGVRRVTTSSSASDAYASLRAGPANSPQAALDGDLGTRWLSGTYGEATGEWFELEFVNPVDVNGLSAVFSAASPIGARPNRVVVETDHGSRATAVIAGPWVHLAAPGGLTKRMRITLAATEGGQPNGFGLTEVSIPPLQPQAVGLLHPPARVPALIALEEGARGRSECLALDGVQRCSPTLRVEAEETGLARQWVSPGPEAYATTGTVRPRDGAALEKLLALPGGLSASASSRLVLAPAGRPDAAIDRDPATGWVAGPFDPKPWFDVDLPAARWVTGLRLTKVPELAASLPTKLAVTFDGESSVTVSVDELGRVSFPPRLTSSLRLAFPEARLMENVDSRTGQHTFAPVGFSELEIRGADDLRGPLSKTSETGVRCGFGPDLVVNGERLATAVNGTVGDVLEGRPLTWRPCAAGGRVEIGNGSNTVIAKASAEFAPQALELRSDAPLPNGASVEVDGRRASGAELSLSLPARSGASVVTVTQNFNAGWSAADASGDALQPIRVNGWQQGWLVQAGPATIVRTSFVPDPLYRLGLVLGAIQLAALVIVAGAASRRRDTPANTPHGQDTILLVLAGLVLAAAGGWAALGGLAAAWLVLRGTSMLTSRGRGPGWLDVAAVGLALGATWFATRGRWPDSDALVSSAAAQVLTWSAVAWVVVRALELLRTPRTRRMAGRSMP